MFQMKRFSLAAIAVMCLSLAAAIPALAVPIISISELGDGVPLWTVSTGIDVIDGSVVAAPDRLAFDAILHIPFGFGVLNDDFVPSLFVLTEPGGGISDWLEVSTPRGTGAPGAADWLQLIHVTFVSDKDVSLGSVTCSAEETGLPQTCHLFSHETRENILDLQVQSDASEVPEPASLLLLGSGLVGLVARRRRAA